MAQTMVNFSMTQTVYQAALQAGAKVIQPTLMDFLH
jgi:flagellin-like hook-associated protein FlgL